jgi:hypothetical protein
VLAPVGSFFIVFEAVPAFAQSSPETPANLAGKASAEPLRDVDTRIAPHEDPREVTMLGVIEIRASLDRFLEHARDIERFVGGRSIRSVSRIQPAALSESVAGFRLPRRDLRLIPDCAIGACRVKLSAPLIEDLHALDSRSPIFDEQVTAAMQGWLEHYVRDYLAHGDTTLIMYADQKEPAHPAAPFHDLVTSSAAFMELPEALRKSLLGTTDSSSPTAETLLYWSVEETGLRPLTVVSQAFVIPPERTGRVEAWAALKQLYASHYQLTSLRLFHASEVTRSGEQEVLRVTVVDRRVFDNPAGGIRRAILEHRLEAYLEGRLRELRDALELPAPGVPAASHQ